MLTEMFKTFIPFHLIICISRQIVYDIDRYTQVWASYAAAASAI